MSEPLAGSGPERLPQLTSLRFFAAFWVLGFHTIPRAGTPAVWSAFWNLGWMGVTFFFVLSGFILTYTYGRKTELFDRRQFWIARVVRVYPLYLFAMLFAVPQLVHSVRHPSVITDAIDGNRLVGVLLSSVAMLQAWFGNFVCIWNCPSWSLSDEAFFYMLFPLLVPLTVRPRGRMFVLIVAIGAMGLIAAGATGASGSELLAEAAGASLNPLARLPEFLLGVWLGGVYLARRPMWRPAPWFAPIITFAIVAFAIWAGLHSTFHTPHLVAAPLFAALVFTVASSPSPQRGILAAAPLVLLGEASYALYMLHGPLHGYMLAAFHRLTPSASGWNVFIVYVITALAFAVASFRLLERPMRVWLRARFSSSPRGIA